MDTGIGTSKQKYDLLFRAFNQVDNSTTIKFDGTGLGLSKSKSLTELLSEKMGVISEIKQGSTFWFTVKNQKLNKKKVVESTVNFLNKQF
ncbi:MAG: hypothetical protein HRU38_13590 [Saccharospirillaceae bacterium]|nr:ATP-binding protein [Pseudomonadales bacterium]NRB79677.1 hypothetical protein [Saccharospirillaceae bacterium]